VRRTSRWSVIADYEIGVSTPIAFDLDAIQDVLERAGIEFLDDGQPGVRMRTEKR
jgi:hypothetical protein